MKLYRTVLSQAIIIGLLSISVYGAKSFYSTIHAEQVQQEIEENRRSVEMIAYKTTKLYDDQDPYTHIHSAYPDTIYILVSTLAHRCITTGEYWQLDEVGKYYSCKWR